MASDVILRRSLISIAVFFAAIALLAAFSHRILSASIDECQQDMTHV